MKVCRPPPQRRAVAEFGEGAEIAQFHQRVGRSFQKDEPRVFLKRAFNFFEIRSIDVGKCQAEVDQDLIEQAWGAP